MLFRLKQDSAETPDRGVIACVMLIYFKRKKWLQGSVSTP